MAALLLAFSHAPKRDRRQSGVPAQPRGRLPHRLRGTQEPGHSGWVDHSYRAGRITACSTYVDQGSPKLPDPL